ncbi:MAG: peptidase C39 [Pirellulaceae bacterium]
MNDIWIAVGVMSSVSMLSGLLAFWLHPRGRQGLMLCMAVSILGMFYFQLYASGQLFWARLLPVSAAIIYSNFSAPLAALAAGWAAHMPNTPVWRRTLMVVLLGGGSLAAILWPLLSITLRPAPAGGDDWAQGVARQTSWATCSPAAAATLLRAGGIDVSESQMIPLCLTDGSGTPTLGLYRGVKLVAEQQGRHVEIIDATLDELMAEDNWPALLAVKLPLGTEDRRYADQWGWIPGMGHSVVVLGSAEQDQLWVGDPAVGLERWSRRDLEILWHGDGLRVR